MKKPENSLYVTQKIVRVMELSSLGKLKTVKQNAENTIEYYSVLFYSMKKLEHLFEKFKEREKKRALIFVVSSTKGFCGAYNKEVFNKIDEIELTLENKVKTDYVVIGKKGKKYLEKNKANIVEFIDQEMEEVTFETTMDILDKYFEQILDNEYQQLFIVFTKYENPMKSEAQGIQVFPEIERFLEPGVKEEVVDFFDYEEKDSIVIRSLLHNYLLSLLYSCLVFSVASEISLRRTTMHEARKSIQELIQAKEKQYKKEKRAQETSDLIDIIGSSKALKRGGRNG